MLGFRGRPELDWPSSVKTGIDESPAGGRDTGAEAVIDVGIAEVGALAGGAAFGAEAFAFEMVFMLVLAAGALVGFAGASFTCVVSTAALEEASADAAGSGSALYSGSSAP